MPRKLAQWLKKTVANIADPEREDRISHIADQLYRGIRQQKRSFSLSGFLGTAEVNADELAEGKQRVFNRLTC